MINQTHFNMNTRSCCHCCKGRSDQFPKSTIATTPAISN